MTGMRFTPAGYTGRNQIRNSSSAIQYLKTDISPVRVSPHEREFFVFVNNMFYIKMSDL